MVERSPGTRPRPLVLIADDSLDTREMYAIDLQKVGYSIETAAGGR